MSFEIVAMTSEHPRYSKVFAQIEADPQIYRDAWAFAESRIAQHLPVADPSGEPGWPGRCWWVALTPDGEPMAWAAAQLTWGFDEHTGRPFPLVLHRDFFHVPRFYEFDVVPHVFDAREAATRHLPGVTFVFRELLDLHLQEGWSIFDQGVSCEPGIEVHEWWGLRRAGS